MPLAALIDLSCADGWPKLLGRTLLEYQARRLRRVGVSHLVLIVPEAPLTPLPIATLTGLGFAVDLVGSGSEAAERIHPSETVILADPRAMLPDVALERLANGEEPLVLTVANVPEHEAFELIDAGSRWPGWARVSGESAWRIGSQIGEWDLISTLMRRAVQSGAVRDILARDTVTRLHDGVGASDYGDTLLLSHEVDMFEDWVGQQAGPRLALFAHRRALDPRLFAAGGSAVGAVAVVLAAVGWLVPAALALLAGSWLALAGDRLLGAMGLGAELRRPLRYFRGGSAALVLAFTAAALWRTSGQWGVLVLAAIIAAAVAAARASDRPRYRLDVTTVAGLFAIPALFGAPMLGLALAATASAFSLMLDHARLLGNYGRRSTGT